MQAQSRTVVGRAIPASLVGVASLVAIPGGGAVAQAGTEPEPLPPLDIEEEIARVAEDTGVAPALVRKHFELRSHIAALRDELVDHPHFAGLWVEQDTVFRVVVAFAGVADPAAELAPAAAGFPAPTLLEARAASHTMAALEGTLDDLAQEREVLRPSGAPLYDLAVDEVGNQVVVETTAAGLPHLPAGATGATGGGGGAASRSSGPGGEPLVRVEVVDELAEPECGRTDCDPYALGALTTTSCTTAFSASLDGVLGVLTAGHCSNVQLHGGVNIGPVVVEQFAGAVDAQWHQVPAGWTDWAAVLVDLPDEPFRAVRSVAEAGSDYVGMPVCVSGAVNLFNCGVVNGLAYSPAFTGGGPFTADFRTATYASASGDSGAPVMFGEQAEGIHSGKRNSDGSAIYGHISSAVEALGVRVNTK